MRRPRFVIGAALVLTALVAAGLPRLRLRTDGHALVPPDAPAVVFDERVRSDFGLRDPLVVLLRPTHGAGIHEPRTLRLIRQLTEALSGLPGVGASNVRSLTTETGDRFRPGSAERRRLLDPVPETPEEVERLRGDVDAVGLLRGTLISNDANAAAILVGVPPGGDATALVLATRDLLARSDTRDHEVAVLGAPAAEALLGLHILDDLEVLLPVAIGLMALVFLVGFRSVRGALLPLAEAGACLVFVFGLMGWIGVPVYLTMAVLPVILVSMGLADEVHVFSAYRDRRGEHPAESLADSVRAACDRTALPVLATGATTCIGFLAFGISSLPPVRAFGILAAVGIAYCVLWTLLVVPALLMMFPPADLRPPREPHPAAWRRLAEALARRPWPTLALLVLLVAAALPGLGRVRVQDSWIGGFARDSEFHRATTFFNRNFAGGHRLLLVVDAGRLVVDGSVSAADLDLFEIRLPTGVAPDPGMLAGSTVEIALRPRAIGTEAPSGPRTWTSIVAAASIRDGRTILTTPPVHGSAKFLLRPAASDSLDFRVRSHRLAVPAVLRAIAALEEDLRARPELGVGGVTGPPDYVASAEFLTSDRAPGSRGIPSDPDRVRWLWTSMERVLGADRLREVVDPGLHRGIVTVFLGDANYADTASLMAAVRAYERAHLAGAGLRVDFAGDVAVSQALIEAIVRSQVGSLLGSLLGIGAVTSLLFRSLRRGLLCMTPAGLAVLAAFASMGWTGTPLGVATSMFAGMVLGVGVDFAIHLIDRYGRLRGDGLPHVHAVGAALAATGPAILINGMAVMLGFGVLVLSRVPANAWLGELTVVSLGACLAATLLVLPALLGTLPWEAPAGGKRRKGS